MSSSYRALNDKGTGYKLGHEILLNWDEIQRLVDSESHSKVKARRSAASHMGK